MKLLVYNWDFITKFDLYNTLKSQNINYDLFSSKFSPRVGDELEKFREELREKMKNKHYDAIFSINYFSILAEMSKEKEILYICWTYDSPNLTGHNNTLSYDTNRIFLFDSHEYNTMKAANPEYIHYLPLAVNAKRLSQFTVDPILSLKYDSDISFVGQLYQSHMDKIYPLLDEYSAGYISAIINTQMNHHENRFLDELINEKILNKMLTEEVRENIRDNLNDGFYKDVQKMEVYHLRGFLLKAITNKERVLLLTLLAKYFRVNLFTPGNPSIPNVRNCGTCDYNNIAPKVFKCSRINLNVTLRNIPNGIPQRVLDIMGSGSLVLTNYQADLEEYFTDGKNILIYHNIEEALEKCRFYLKNYYLAEKIRDNGVETIKKHFTFEERLNKIWEITKLK